MFFVLIYFFQILEKPGWTAGRRSCWWPPGGRRWNCTGISTHLCFPCDQHSHPSQDSQHSEIFAYQCISCLSEALPVCWKHFLFVGCTSQLSKALPICPVYVIFLKCTSCLSEALPICLEALPVCLRALPVCPRHFLSGRSRDSQTREEVEGSIISSTSSIRF